MLLFLDERSIPLQSEKMIELFCERKMTEKRHCIKGEEKKIEALTGNPVYWHPYMQSDSLAYFFSHAHVERECSDSW